MTPTEIEAIENDLFREHAKRLHAIEKTLTGNGGDQKDREDSVVWQIRLLVERQKPLYDFINGVKKFWWIMVTVGMGGALAAIFQMVKFLIIQGKI